VTINVGRHGALDLRGLVRWRWAPACAGR
jgi:hypothetical protein